VQIHQALNNRRDTLVRYRSESPKGDAESFKFWTDRIAMLDAAEQEFSQGHAGDTLAANAEVK
jgi:hypothetical protein